MSAQRTDEVLEGLEPGAHRRVHPAFEVLCGPSGLRIAPQVRKSFFEVLRLEHFLFKCIHYVR